MGAVEAAGGSSVLISVMVVVVVVPCAVCVWRLRPYLMEVSVASGAAVSNLSEVEATSASPGVGRKRCGLPGPRKVSASFGMLRCTALGAT